MKIWKVEDGYGWELLFMTKDIAIDYIEQRGYKPHGVNQWKETVGYSHNYLFLHEDEVIEK